MRLLDFEHLILNIFRERYQTNQLARYLPEYLFRDQGNKNPDLIVHFRISGFERLRRVSAFLASAVFFWVPSVENSLSRIQYREPSIENPLSRTQYREPRYDCSVLKTWFGAFGYLIG